MQLNRRWMYMALAPVVFAVIPGAAVLIGGDAPDASAIDLATFQANAADTVGVAPVQDTVAVAPPTGERGGRRKKLYHLTRDGLAAVRGSLSYYATEAMKAQPGPGLFGQAQANPLDILKLAGERGQRGLFPSDELPGAAELVQTFPDDLPETSEARDDHLRARVLDHVGLGGVDHQRRGRLRGEPAGDLVHVGGAVAADVVDADVEQVRAVPGLVAGDLDAPLPVPRQHGLAEGLGAVGVGALADDEEGGVLMEGHRAVDGRRARLVVGRAAVDLDVADAGRGLRNESKLEQ